MKAMKLIASLVISFAAGVVGNIATIPNIPTWYAGLEKPLLNPPNIVFGPVWTILYLLIAISLYLVWVHPAKNKTAAYIAFATQILLNTLWSLVFFGLHAPLLAVAVVLLLVMAIIATIISFHRVSKVAAYLLIPYVVWVGFATYLTIGIAVLN
jgi:tryptophan-rich sensory protein